MFNHHSYKDLLKDVLEDRRKSLGKAYTFQAMAQACQVQKTYLSRVFNGEGQLNEDQVFLACNFLGVSDEEREFISLLHRAERSTVRQLQEQLQNRIQDIRKKHQTTESQLNIESVKTYADGNLYHLDPNMQLVHMFLTVERFAADMTRMRRVLGIEEKEMSKILINLLNLGMIKFQDSKYVVVQEMIHLSVDSPIYKTSLTLQKLKAMQRADGLTRDDSYNFSVLFTADETVRGRVKAKFMEFLKFVESEVKHAPCQEVYHLGFDLLKWS